MARGKSYQYWREGASKHATRHVAMALSAREICLEAQTASWSTNDSYLAMVQP
jgi:hypothetical protein